MLELNRCYNMDCIEGMKKFPDKYFDLAVVDPPYGSAGGEFKRTDGSRFGGKFDAYKPVEEKKIDRTGRTWAKKYGRKIISWDQAPGEDYFTELFRVSKNQIIWGGELLWTSAKQMLSDMEKNKHTGEFHNVDGGICLVQYQRQRKNV